MKFSRSWLKWGKSKKVPDSKKKGFDLIYGWASPQKAALSPCPYVYIFKITSPHYSEAGLRSGRRTRRAVFSQLFSENSYRRIDDPNKVAADIWDEIIPSEHRPATHRIEIGILRKGSGVPRSPFFSEYFCFKASGIHKSSDRVAVQIAGFVADQLEECDIFDGAAIGGNPMYWRLCIYAAWKRYGRG
jgi:hypothetical protein